jgi:hypothetical protein
MPTALKISCSEITEVEVSNDGGFIRDPDYLQRKRPFDSHALARPETWDGRKFSLAFACWDQFYETDFSEDTINILGSYLYRMLKHRNAIADDGIPGPVYLINEDRDGIIELTKEDLRYIVQRSRQFEDLENPQDLPLMLQLLGAILINYPELR